MKGVWENFCDLFYFPVLFQKMSSHTQEASDMQKIPYLLFPNNFNSRTRKGCDEGEKQKFENDH